jgi:hypothetical protein
MAHVEKQEGFATMKSRKRNAHEQSTDDGNTSVELPASGNDNSQPTPENQPSVAAPPAPANDNFHAANDNQPSFAERVGQRKRVIDPYGIATDNLAGVRLFESQQDRWMAIQFFDTPTRPVIDKVKEAGFHWNPTHRIWTHPLRAENRMRTRIEAERLYQEVCQTIRQEKGISSGQEVPF